MPTAGGSNGQFWVEGGSIPAARNVLTFKILNRTNGKYPDNQVFWSFNGQTRSIAEQSTIDMPVVSSARMYFRLGSANSQYSDFIEFNTKANWIGVNTTRVDGFGLKLALRSHTKSGRDTTVGENQATFAEDRGQTFQRFMDAMPTEFKGLAQTQAPYRILAPGNSAAFQSGGQYANYFTDYVSRLGYSISTRDVFACDGATLKENSRLCGAINRHVADLPQSQWGDVGKYYRSAPANFYARFWHERAIDSKAYGFPYDDVADQSTFVSDDNPQYLQVAVGW